MSCFSFSRIGSSGSWRRTRRVVRLCGPWVLGVVLVSGCADSGTAVSQNPLPAATPALAPAQPAVAPAAQPAVEPVAPPPEFASNAVPDATPPADPAAPPAPSGSIIGKKTSDVRDADKERRAGAKEVKPKITGKDPITVTGNAYTAMIGRTEQLKIKHQLDLWATLNDRYPKDYDEFKREIIDKTGIRLTQLPHYQKYGYDAEKHELVILEYPH